MLRPMWRLVPPDGDFFIIMYEILAEYESVQEQYRWIPTRTARRELRAGIHTVLPAYERVRGRYFINLLHAPPYFLQLRGRYMMYCLLCKLTLTERVCTQKTDCSIWRHIRGILDNDHMICNRAFVHLCIHNAGEN